MKIAIVSQYYFPDRPGRFVDEVSRNFVERGHRVRIISTPPHYDLDDYGKLPSSENRQGVEVRRVPLIRKRNGALLRIANYLSFSVSALSQTWFVRGADVIYVHGTPATTVIPAQIWAKLLKIPYVFHVQDIWPESVTASGFLPPRVTRPIDRIIGFWLARAYRNAASVIAIAPSARRLLIERGTPHEKAHLVFNWARVAREPQPKSSSESSLMLLYAGNIGPLQDLETVIRAVALVSDRPGLRVRIVGDGSERERLETLVAELGVAEVVQFLGQVSADVVLDEYAKSDFQLVTLKDLAIFRGTIPSKFQEGLASGLPVITTVLGDVSDLVRDNGLGFTAQPENPASLAEAIEAAYKTSTEQRQDLAASAFHFYADNLSQQSAIDRIEKILRFSQLDGSRRSCR